jgi:hypothetical protein
MFFGFAVATAYFQQDGGVRSAFMQPTGFIAAAPFIL